MIPKRDGRTDDMQSHITALCVASRGNNAFELNNSINHGKITVLHLLLLTSLPDSHCLRSKQQRPFKRLKLYIVYTTAMYCSRPKSITRFHCRPSYR